VRRAPVLAIALVLGGCAGGLPVATPSSDRETSSAADALASARAHAAQGRWQAAFAALDTASTIRPDDPDLAAGRRELEQRRADAVQRLEDGILVGDAEGISAKLQLLDALERVDPDRLFVKARRLYWREMLDAKRDALVDCAERQVSQAPPLAGRCYAVAAELVDGGDAMRRLDRVRDRLAADERVAEQARRQQALRARQAEVRALLRRAEDAIAENDFRAAMRHLDHAAALQPADPRVEALRESARSIVSPQVEALVKLGDQLYLDERLEAAVATWQAALDLQPGDEDIAARIARATAVLDRLESLRERQHGPVPE
jgi:Flp pilus assembly protein TadD